MRELEPSPFGVGWRGVRRRRSQSPLGSGKHRNEVRVVGSGSGKVRVLFGKGRKGSDPLRKSSERVGSSSEIFGKGRVVVAKGSGQVRVRDRKSKKTLRQEVTFSTTTRFLMNDIGRKMERGKMFVSWRHGPS